MKKIFVLFLTLAITIGCSEEEPRDCCINISADINLQFVNESGVNILEEENGIVVADIRLHHKVGEDWVAYFQGNLDYPRGVRLVDEMGQRYLTVYPDLETIENGIIQTRIDFGNGDVDFITSAVEVTGPNRVITKVYYNEEVMWEAADGPRFFTIIK